jgi:hypothetical protein
MAPQTRARRPPRPLAWAASAVCLTAPASAAATDGSHPSHTPLLAVVGVVLAAGAAYLLAHVVVGRLQRRFLVSPGAEYVLLGAILGPAGALWGLGVLRNLAPLLPFVALAAGWVGLLRGTELDLRRLVAAPEGALRVLLLHHGATGLGVGAAAYALLSSGLVPGVGLTDAAIAAWVLGCCAAADSAGPVEVLQQRYTLTGRLPELLRRSAVLGDLLVILVFGLLFCVFHRGDAAAALQLTATEWAVLSLGLGVVMGLLFGPFLGAETSPHERFLALVGIITFAAGAAWFLRLDPLLVNMSLGIVLVNSGRRGPHVRLSLQGTARPQALILLVLAGALWQPPQDPESWRIAGVGVAAFVLLRLLGKVAGSWLAALGTSLRPDLFRGLLGHGEVTVAMAISFRLVYGGPAVDLAYTIILASVLLHDLVAPRLLRSLLVDAGAITREGIHDPSPAAEAS